MFSLSPKKIKEEFFPLSVHGYWESCTVHSSELNHRFTKQQNTVFSLSTGLAEKSIQYVVGENHIHIIQYFMCIAKRKKKERTVWIQHRRLLENGFFIQCSREAISANYIYYPLNP